VMHASSIAGSAEKVTMTTASTAPSDHNVVEAGGACNRSALVSSVRRMTGTIYITGDPAADGLLNADGTALLIGMLLDQQVPMEWAFMGPATLRARLGHLDARKIAA